MDYDYPVPTQAGPYEGASTGMAKMVGMPTLKLRLTQAVQEAEQRLADAKRAREIFDRNPDLEELMNIMQKGRF